MYSYTSTTQTVPTLDEIEFALQRTKELVQNATYPSHEYMAQVFRSIFPHVLNAVMTYEEMEEEENEDAYEPEPVNSGNHVSMKDAVYAQWRSRLTVAECVERLVEMGAKYYSGEHPFMEGYPRLVLPKEKQ